MPEQAPWFACQVNKRLIADLLIAEISGSQAANDLLVVMIKATQGDNGAIELKRSSVRTGSGNVVEARLNCLGDFEKVARLNQ